jgi:hypothetical protein
VPNATVRPFDPELQGLVIDRQRLLRELAPILRRLGPHYENRATLNKRRAIKRHNLRKQLARNAEAIAARVALLYDQQLDLEITLNVDSPAS